MTDKQPGAPTGYRYIVVALLGLAYLLSYADRQVLAALVDPVKRELSLTDTQIGLLSGIAFTLFYAGFALPLAWLADRVNRVRIIAVACLIWSMCSAASGLATNFVHLMFARIGIGIGEAGGSNPAYSLMCDYFPPSERGTAFALYTMGAPFGIAAAAALGGFVAAAHGWRAAFYAVSLPGILVAALILIVIREPERGRFDNPESGIRRQNLSVRVFLGTFFRQPMLIGTSAAGSISALIATAVPAWAPAFLIRSKGMSLRDVALYYSLCVGSAMAVGTLASGRLLDYIGAIGARDGQGVHNRQAHTTLSAVATLIALPFFVCFIYAPDWRWGLVFLWLASMLVLAYFTPCLVAVQNAVGSTERAIAGSVHMFILNLVGQALGPLVVGMASDYGKAHGFHDPLQFGVACVLPFFVLAIIAHLYVGGRIKRSDRRVDTAPPGEVLARAAR